MMRILHAPTNIAGQPHVLSRALRRMGHESDVLATEHHAFGYPEDILFNYDRLPTPWRQVRKGVELARLVRRYEVFHFYYGESLLAAHRDVPLLRKAGKRIVFHFRGCDIRMRALSLARPVSACLDCPAPCQPDPIKRDLRDAAWRLADRVLVATPDLLESVPGAELVTQAIDLDEWPELPPRVTPRGNFVILHAPSDPIIKGTVYVERAVAALQAAGYPVELRLLQRRPHAEIRQAFAEADIVVDQLLLGWYANFAIEAMASSRPVIAFIRDDLPAVAGYTPPILSATPATIQRVLAEVLENAMVRRSLAEAGREYVSRIHSPNRIATRLVECYQRPGTVH
jgi:glycosyltransferase involved in cell wall biosynthesis